MSVKQDGVSVEIKESWQVFACPPTPECSPGYRLRLGLALWRLRKVERFQVVIGELGAYRTSEST